VLLLGMAALQLMHGEFLVHGTRLLDSKIYAALLYVVAPAFYLFFSTALQPAGAPLSRRLLCVIPLAMVPFVDTALSIPLSFVFGTAYAAHLSLLVWRLREHRKRFRLEAAVFGVFALMASSILVLGLLAPLSGERAYVLGYAILTGLAFWLVLFGLLRFPDIVANATDAVRATYVVSTLNKVDRERALASLTRLMEVEKVYADEGLSLARLAEMLALTPHQLSELINTHFGFGFSRFVREHRVAAAKHMLTDEPDASVLSVGLSVGFSSQSNFYAAFREITGGVPGKFRKQQALAMRGERAEVPSSFRKDHSASR